MRTLCRLVIITGILAINLLSGTIEFDVSIVGTTGSGETLYRYVYSLDQLTLQKDMEVDIRFDSALYGVLSNPVAPGDFDVLILQPDNPPGVPGDYSALALVDNPTVSGLFSVDFTFTGLGAPGSQPFFINLIDPLSGAITPIDSGFTTSPGAVVPEPGTLGFGCAAIVTSILARALARSVRDRMN
jgi:hypothetical protein